MVLPLLQNKHKKQGEKNRYQLSYHFNQQQIGVAIPDPVPKRIE
jgi:hypothetical protein